MALLSPDDLAFGQWYKHNKTGDVYQIIMFATIEKTNTPAVVYAAKHHGDINRWVRPIEEFCDGRFSKVDMKVTS